MARNRRGNSQRVETSVELVKVVAHTQGKKTIYRGIIKHEDKEYFFTANTKCIPVVLGAPNIELMKETAKAVNNWHKANKRGGQFYADIDKLFNGAEIKLYTKEMSNGVFMLKNSAGYMGYLPGAAGIRAVYMNHKDQKPYSCALKSWGKLVDNNDAKPFRTMASQGQKIREEMIPELMRIKAILDNQTKKPDPDGPGPNRTKEETKPQPEVQVQIEKETQQAQEEPQRTTRRRRTTVMENNQEQPTVKKSEIVICYCGSCNCDTEQERVNDSEVMCKECGSQWEYFPEETEEVKQEETKEEIVVEETIEEEPQISVEEEMEETMKHEEKKVEEQVREELEQRSTRRRTRRTVEEIPQVTNEDMHGKETNDESTVVRQDNGAEEIPSNTNDVSNIPTNDESTEDECDDSYDVELDTDADEAGDSFEVEAGILW
jgi:hypothetical protein